MKMTLIEALDIIIDMAEKYYRSKDRFNDKEEEAIRAVRDFILRIKK